MIDLHPNGMVLRAGIPGNPNLKNWLDVYMDYLVAEGIDLDKTQICIHMPEGVGWTKIIPIKTPQGWRYGVGVYNRDMDRAVVFSKIDNGLSNENTETD